MSNKKLTLYKFDDFCLDTYRKRLFYADSPVSLTPKAFQTLLVLLKNRNEIVGKEFLLNEVWADTFVEETTLSQNILTLRKTLGAFQKDKEFIVTFPRQGFRFVADVQEIVTEEETIIVEKQTLTHIVAEQQLIHDSAETKETAIKIQPQSISNTFLSLKTITFATICLMCLGIGGLATWLFLQTNNFTQFKSPKLLSTTLVSDSNIKNAVISPNGKYLALVAVDESKQSLLLRQIENGNTIEIVPNLIGTVIGLTFSPDNEQIYYAIYDNSEPNKSPVGNLYKIAILGGAPKMVLAEVDSLATISPDNQKIAFIRKNSINDETTLIITDIEGKNEKILATRSTNESFTTSGVAWSPDGNNLSATVTINENSKLSIQIAIFDVHNGEQKLLTNQNWNWAGQTVWLKNGSEIVVPAFRQESPTLSDELWLISYPDGKAKYLTNGIKGKLGISLNGETDSIVALKTDKLTCFLSAALDNFKKSNHISTRVGDSCQFPIGADWTNDGKIVYSTTEGGNADIWTIKEDGGEKRQLTADDSAEISPKLSPDGRTLIFLSNRSGQMNIWRANANGTNPTQLTETENVKETFFSPDGNFIYFLAISPENSTETLWRITVTGTNKTQITTKSTKSPKISSDGKTIAAYFPNAENNLSLTLISAETGEVLKYLETPPHDDIPFLEWSKDGQNLYVIIHADKPFSLWKIAVNNAKAEKMREWENDAIFRFVISKDGNRVFYEVGTELNSVVQLDNILLTLSN